MRIPIFDAVWRFDIVDYEPSVGDEQVVMCKATTERCGSFSYRITMYEGTKNYESVMAHEAVHLAIMLLRDAGVVETDNHECLAYLVEYLVKTMLNLWKKNAALA